MNRGTIRNSYWDVYVIRNKKPFLKKEKLEVLICEFNGDIIDQHWHENNVAISVFGKQSSVFKEKRYAFRNITIDFSKDFGKTNYFI